MNNAVPVAAAGAAGAAKADADKQRRNAHKAKIAEAKLFYVQHKAFPDGTRQSVVKAVLKEMVGMHGFNEYMLTVAQTGKFHPGTEKAVIEEYITKALGEEAAEEYLQTLEKPKKRSGDGDDKPRTVKARKMTAGTILMKISIIFQLLNKSASEVEMSAKQQESPIQKPHENAAKTFIEGINEILEETKIMDGLAQVINADEVTILAEYARKFNDSGSNVKDRLWNAYCWVWNLLRNNCSGGVTGFLNDMQREVVLKEIDNGVCNVFTKTIAEIPINPETKMVRRTTVKGVTTTESYELSTETVRQFFGVEVALNFKQATAPTQGNDKEPVVTEATQPMVGPAGSQARENSRDSPPPTPGKSPEPDAASTGRMTRSQASKLK